MLNRIWFWLLLIGIVYGFGKAAIGKLDPAAVAVAEDSVADSVGAETTTSPLGSFEPDPLRRSDLFKATGQDLTEAAIGAAEASVEICIGLIGVMALWLGMLRIARDAGLVDALSRFLRPVMRWLFPEVPDGHPAQGAMLMNISANMLGLDNAATPFGLKAMQELQELNPNKDTATNAMAMFLAINTSNVTIIPISIIALRSAADSQNAAAPLGGILLTTSVTTIVAIVAVKMFCRMPQFANVSVASGDSTGGGSETDSAGSTESGGAS